MAIAHLAVKPRLKASACYLVWIDVDAFDDRITKKTNAQNSWRLMRLAAVIAHAVRIDGDVAIKTTAVNPGYVGYERDAERVVVLPKYEGAWAEIFEHARAQFGKPEQHYEDEAIRENPDRSLMSSC